jgi:iron complex outermembrane recepter protein
MQQEREPMKVATRIFRTAMLSTISVASLGFGTVAFAQEAAPQDATEEEFSEDDIIVTATKREQTLQDVPVAVSVTSAAARKFVT